MITEPSLSLDLGALERRLPDLRRRYESAEPFPHVLIERVLPDDVFARATSEFPPIDDPSWASYVHVNEAKYANQRPESWGPALRSVARALTSDRFVHFVEALTSHEHLHADWSMDGGGLHQTVAGGHLNVHADFTTHHRHHHWQRRVNVLLYLNETWDPDWGGALELWDADMSACRRRVPPIGNTMLVFTTSERSYHGHPDPLRCPPGVARRSLALYYFTVERRPVPRSTNYRARPGDGWKRLAIAADRTALGMYDRIKRRAGLSDRAVFAMLRRMNGHNRPGR